jgi:hypothetical protein
MFVMIAHIQNLAVEIAAARYYTCHYTELAQILARRL